MYLGKKFLAAILSVIVYTAHEEHFLGFFDVIFPSDILLDTDFEGVVAQLGNPLTLQPQQSGGVGSKPGGAPPLERHDKGSRSRADSIRA